MKHISISLAVVALLTLASCGKEQAQKAHVAPTLKLNNIEVAAIDDGDTIQVLINMETIRIRLLNVDAPELDSPGYYNARKALKGMLSGGRVSLTYNPEPDNWGRLHGYVFIGETNINIEMVRAGWSEYSTKGGESEFAKEFKAAEKEAEKEKRGIWAEAE